MARIPDAFFDGGFGQQKVQRSTYIPSGPAPGAILAQGMGNLSNSLVNVALTLQQKQNEADAEASRQAKAQADEFERRERQRKGAEAQLSLVSHADTLHSVANLIANDSSLDAQAKREQFETQSQNVATSLLSPLDDENKQALAPTFERNRLTARQQLEDNLIRESRDATRALTIASAEAITASARPLKEKLALLHDPNFFAGSGLSDEDQRRSRDHYVESATLADIDSRFNREDPARIKAELSAKTGTDYRAYAGLDPVKRQAYLRTADNLIEQRQREAENRQKQAAGAKNNAAKDAFEIYKNYREQLLPLPPKVEAQLWERMIGSEYEPLAAGVKEKTASLAFVQEKVNADPLTHGAARLGLIVPPLSVENPAAWPQQLAERSRVGEAIAQEYGLPYTPILKADEAKALGRTLSIQPPAALMNVVQGFKSTGSLRAIAGQIAQEDRSLATVMALAEENPSGAYLVAQGRALQQAGSKPDNLVAKELKLNWQEQTSGALLGMEKMKLDLEEATALAYLAKAQGQTRFDADLYEETMAAVVGSTAKINGKRTFLPMGMEETDFLDNLRSAINPARLEAAGDVAGFDSSLDASRRMDARSWYQSGDGARFHETETAGVYLVELDGEMLMTKKDPSQFLRLTIGGAR